MCFRFSFDCYFQLSSVTLLCSPNMRDGGSIHHDPSPGTNCSLLRFQAAPPARCTFTFRGFSEVNVLLEVKASSSLWSSADDEAPFFTSPFRPDGEMNSHFAAASLIVSWLFVLWWFSVIVILQSPLSRCIALIIQFAFCDLTRKICNLSFHLISGLLSKYWSYYAPISAYKICE